MRALVVAVVCCALAASAAGRALLVDGRGPHLVGVRSLAMGDAFVSVAEEAAGAMHNPAGLGIGEGVHLFGQTNPTARARLRFDPKGIAYRWRGWGASWGNKIALHESAVADYNEWAVGRRLSSHLAAGAGVSLRRAHPSRHFQVWGHSAEYRLGFLAAGSARTRFGLRVEGLRPGGGPSQAALGAAAASGRALYAIEAEWKRAGGASLRLGGEWSLDARTRLRAGWRSGAPTAGVGVRMGPARVDAGWTRVEGLHLLFIGAEAALTGAACARHEQKGR
jgi:hypothetical protein